MQNYHNPVYPRTLGAPALLRGALWTLAPSVRLALGAILLLAVVLRTWGLGFGLPYIIQPDEPSVELRVLHMWLAADPNPHYFVYPSLYYDLQAIWTFVVGHAVGLAQPDVLRHPLMHLPMYYLAGRLLTAVLGTLTVLVVYLLGRLLSPRIGLLAALFLAAAAQHIQQSHYITVDAPTALFTALSALFAVRSLRQDGHWLRNITLAGLAAGLAAGTKYNAGVALALPAVAALLSGTVRRRRRVAAVGVAALACAVTFVVTTPFAVLDLAPLLRSLAVVARHYATGHPGAEGGDNALWYLQYLWTDGFPLLLTALAILGVLVAVARYRRAGLTLLAFALPYYALLSSTYVRFDRNLLPLAPFLAIFAACAAEAVAAIIARVIRNRAAAYAVVIALAVAPSLYTAAYAGTQSDYAISHPFSEQVAVAWVDAHIPAGAVVATENWEGRPFELSSRHYRIINQGSLAWKPYAWYIARGVRYAVADSWTDGAYLRDPHRYPVEVARYRELYRRARLLHTVPGGTLARPGPAMSVYVLR